MEYKGGVVMEVWGAEAGNVRGKIEGYCCCIGEGE